MIGEYNSLGQKMRLEDIENKLNGFFLICTKVKNDQEFLIFKNKINEKVVIKAGSSRYEGGYFILEEK